MSSAKTKKFDRNRFRKVYPRFRVLPSWSIRSDKEIVLETLRVKFKNQDQINFELNGRYTSTPGVVVTPIGDIGDVNIFIQAISLGSVPAAGGKTVNVTLGASVSFEGEVFVQVMQI